MHAEFWRIQGASWSLCKHFLPHILVTFRQWHLSKLQTLLLQYSRLIAFRKTGDHPCNTMWISCHNTGIFFFFFYVCTVHARTRIMASVTDHLIFLFFVWPCSDLSLSLCVFLIGRSAHVREQHLHMKKQNWILSKPRGSTFLCNFKIFYKSYHSSNIRNQWSHWHHRTMADANLIINLECSPK